MRYFPVLPEWVFSLLWTGLWCSQLSLLEAVVQGGGWQHLVSRHIMASTTEAMRPQVSYFGVLPGGKWLNFICVGLL